MSARLLLNPEREVNFILGEGAAGSIYGRITEMRRRRVGFSFEDYMKHAMGVKSCWVY